MKISQLPTAIRLRAERYQIEQEKGNENTDCLIDAFVWDETKEGHKYWSELENAVEFFTLERSE